MKDCSRGIGGERVHNTQKEEHPELRGKEQRLEVSVLSAGESEADC